MRGCPFHNAAVEAADSMPEIHDIVQEHRRNYIKGLIKLARQAGAANPTLLGNNSASFTKVQLRCPPLLMTRLRGHTRVRPCRRSSTKQVPNDAARCAQKTISASRLTSSASSVAGVNIFVRTDVGERVDDCCDFVARAADQAGDHVLCLPPHKGCNSRRRWLDLSRARSPERLALAGAAIAVVVGLG
jgi:hypothetical protein